MTRHYFSEVSHLLDFRKSTRGVYVTIMLLYLRPMQDHIKNIHTFFCTIWEAPFSKWFPCKILILNSLALLKDFRAAFRDEQSCSKNSILTKLTHLLQPLPINYDINSSVTATFTTYSFLRCFFNSWTTDSWSSLSSWGLYINNLLCYFRGAG